MLRDRAARTLTYNDEQFHILEKIKMTETIRTIADLLTKECQPSVSLRTEALADWYKKASTIYLQTEILYKDLSAFEDDVSSFSLRLRHSQDKYLQLVRDLAARVREAREEAVPPPAPTPQPPCDTRNMRKAVKSILSTQVNPKFYFCARPKSLQIIPRALYNLILTNQLELGSCKK